MTTPALSGPEREAIERPLDVSAQPFAHGLPVAVAYQVHETARWIAQHKFQRVALQFPDELLHDSVTVFSLLRDAVPAQLYVLADTTYGSCCVDEVAARHVSADAVVKYGHSCMSPTTGTISILYIYHKASIDVGHLGTLIDDAFPASVRLRFDVGYVHAREALLDVLRQKGVTVSASQSDITQQLQSDVPSDTLQSVDPLEPAQDDNDASRASPPTDILYIGGESVALRNTLLTNVGTRVLVYDPAEQKLSDESYRSNRLHARRYVATQQARDADVFGLVVGTLGVRGYLPLVNELRRLIKMRGKKAYTLSVGKPNPAKLGNFGEIECFVLLSCRENAFLDAKEYMAPVVTPYELLCAFTNEWSSAYELDLQRLLHLSRRAVAQVASTEGGDEPEFSAVTGRYRQARTFADPKAHREGQQDDEQSLALARHTASAMQLGARAPGEIARILGSASAEHLQARTFRGLEVRAGEDAPAQMEEGRSGIARGYAGENEK